MFFEHMKYHHIYSIVANVLILECVSMLRVQAYVLISCVGVAMPSGVVHS